MRDVNKLEFTKMQELEKDNFKVDDFSADAIINKIKHRSKKVTMVAISTFFTVALLFMYGTFCFVKKTHTFFSNSDVIMPFSGSIAATTSTKDLINIPSGVVKANPFLPYNNMDGMKTSITPAFEIIAPPEVISEGSDASRVMDTIVSGILYDASSPSAILNIDGNDYLVKKGDMVNNYKVLDIKRDSVTVKLGANTYKAGIGEILTEGTVNYNEVSNLNSKFGGGK